MKLILLSTFLLLSDGGLFAQNERNDFEPIEAAIRRLQPSGTVYYADNAYRKVYSKLAILISKPSFISQWDTTKENTLNLTTAERKYIQQQLARFASIKMPDSLFENSKRIPENSLISVVDGINRSFLKSINVLPDTLKAKAYQNFRTCRHWSFIFTKSVYIRDRTIAVYYFMYYSLSGGAHGADFYKVKNNEWHRWIMIPGIGGAW